MFVLKDLTLTDESDLDKTIQVQNEEVIKNNGHIKFLEPWKRSYEDYKSNYVYIYNFFLQFFNKNFIIYVAFWRINVFFQSMIFNVLYKILTF